MRALLFTHPLLLAVSLAACFDMPPRPQARGDGGSAVDGSVTRDGPLRDGAAEFNNNVVFVSSSMSTADLGGTSGGDTMCASLAHASGLPGTYVAWLGTSTTSAPSRLGSARGWVRPDGLPVVDTVADLLAFKMIYPIAIDDLGSAHYDETSHALTGTTADGTATTDTCSDYTSTTGSATVGETDGTYGNWTNDGGALSCATPMRLYCFGVDKVTPIVPPTAPVDAKIAFITSASGSGVYTPGGGLAGADAVCASEATAAHLSGTFLALLATTTTTAASRASTGVYARLDGATLGPLSALQAPIDVTAAGTYFSAPGWTGAGSAAQPLTTVGTDATTCSNWSTASAASTGEVGAITIASPTAFYERTSACNDGSNVLYCVQQ